MDSRQVVWWCHTVTTWKARRVRHPMTLITSLNIPTTWTMMTEQCHRNFHFNWLFTSVIARWQHRQTSNVKRGLSLKMRGHRVRLCHQMIRTTAAAKAITRMATTMERPKRIPKIKATIETTTMMSRLNLTTQLTTAQIHLNHVQCRRRKTWTLMTRMNFVRLRQATANAIFFHSSIQTQCSQPTQSCTWATTFQQCRTPTNRCTAKVILR